MRKLNTLLLGISAAVAVIGFTGCASWQRSDGDRTAGRAADDRAITSGVETALHKEPVYKFNDVDVKTYNGIVQLSGFVSTDDQKRRAAEIASRVDGVTQVVNSIAMKPLLSPTGRTNTFAPVTDATTDLQHTNNLHNLNR